MHHQDPTVFYFIAAFLILMCVGQIVLFHSIYMRLFRLIDGGIEAKATIMQYREYTMRSGKFADIRYEFQTSMGETQNGKMNMPVARLSDPQLYAVGNSATVVYLQDNPKNNFPKNELPQNVNRARRMSQIICFTPITTAIMLIVMWFALLNKH